MGEIFAEHAIALYRAGYDVIPADGRVPAVRGYNKWGQRRSESMLSDLARRFPDRNILITTSFGKVVVVRCNDHKATGEADDLFGDTCGKVRRQCGEDRYYRTEGIDLGRRRSLRRYRRNIDMIHGRAGLVLAPPSVTEDGAAEWIDGGPPAIRDLPPLPMKKLQALFKKEAPATIEENGQRAICVSDADEIQRLIGCAQNGADALALLMLLRGYHGARCKRGQTFAISVEAMVRDGVMGKWSARRLRGARNVLLEGGHIHELYPATDKTAAQYMLGPRVLMASSATSQTCTPPSTSLGNADSLGAESSFVAAEIDEPIKSCRSYDPALQGGGRSRFRRRNATAAHPSPHARPFIEPPSVNRVGGAVMQSSSRLSEKGKAAIAVAASKQMKQVWAKWKEDQTMKNAAGTTEDNLTIQMQTAERRKKLNELRHAESDSPDAAEMVRRLIDRASLKAAQV